MRKSFRGLMTLRERTTLRTARQKILEEHKTEMAYTQKRPLKLCLLSTFTALCVTLAAIIGGVAMFTQPSLTSGSPSQVEVFPDRLREHVIALSETFYPRNYTHAVNTERVADYIADHFAQAGAEVFPPNV